MKKYIYLKKYKCWILPEVVLKNKTWKEQQAKVPKGLEIADYEIIQYCRNEKLHKCFEGFWVNVPNPDIRSRKKYVARFNAGSDWADLDCYWNPGGSDSSLGVFVIKRRMRDEKRKSKRNS